MTTVHQFPAPVETGADRDTHAETADARSRTSSTRSQQSTLPAFLDITQAAKILGIGRTLAYELVRTNQWPTPVVRVGRLIRIPAGPLLALSSTGSTELAHVPAQGRAAE